MASAKQRKATFISNKLKFLKDQGDDLISAVVQYVKRITAEGDAWTQARRGDDSMKCQEISQMIDTAVLFLCEKCEELADLTSQSVTDADSTPATSYRHPAIPLASTATTPYGQLTGSVQPAEGAHIKPVLDRIAAIEEVMCSFRSRAEKVAEQQSGIDQQLKELLSNLSESDMKHSSRFKQIKQQICYISEIQDTIEEQKTRLQSLEKKLQEISIAQIRQKAEMESQEELVENLVHVPKLLESVKENVVSLDARIDGIIDYCRNKHEDTKTVISDLAGTVMTNTQSVQDFSKSQDKITSMLKKIEARLQTMETDGWRNEKYVQKQVDKGVSNFRILCQMLNDRLRPLEQLRTCLNERTSRRDDNVTKLSMLLQEVAVMSPRLHQLEMKSHGTRCGFSAWTWLTREAPNKTIIRQYETTHCNVGENFNADSGIFTAPIDGLYVASISVRLWENEHLTVCVEYQQSLGQESSTHVCWNSAATKDTNACDVGVVDMKAGEVLFSRVYLNRMKKNNYDSLESYPSIAQMASAKQRKATFISNKLTFLKDQGDDLISAVGQYVNRITAAGESWTQERKGDDNMECQELCQRIDAAILFLCEKLEEIADLTSESITAATSTPATFDRHPAAPLASTATTSYTEPTESVQPADGAHTKTVLDRIAFIEETMCSFRIRTETVADQQSNIDQQLKEILSKLSELDKKHSSQFKQVKQQISNICETQDALEQEQKTRLQSLEKQLEKISTAQNRQKGEMESQAELVEKHVHVPKLLESVKENVDALDDRIDGIIDDCSNKHEGIDTVARDLTDKVMANTQSVQLISEGQAQITILLKELETRLQTLEADGGRNVKSVQKQAEKGEANFRILCQMLNDRLRPLEQLRTCLNERASERDDNVTKLSQLIQEVAVMSPRLQQLEVKSPAARCGFRAWTWFTKFADNNIIRQYGTTNCNVGENFNAETGIFTSPVDGLYVAAISLWLAENEFVQIGVQYKQRLDQESGTPVCRSSAVTKHTYACNVGVVEMKAGEVLCSLVYHNENNNYNKSVSFSCFLLG